MIESGTLLQGRFLIEGTIGMGGMGAVYRAVDQKFGSLVAIKETFYGDAPQLTEAFEREARLLNGLHHPIFPHVSDCFTENGGHFLVMEYIEGEDLSETLKRGEIFPVETVVGWAHELLDGLDYLHSQDPPIIHRDIKPNNLKLTSRGKIVLLDFGMAKETSSNTYAARSVFGYSRRYSPLEQIEGSGTDPRSDIFSLGATLYHLLTGKPPVDVLARASAIVAGRPDPLSLANMLNRDVPVSIAAALDTALSLNAEKRFQSAREMLRAFDVRGATQQAADVSASAPPIVEEVNSTVPVDVAASDGSQGRVVVLREDDVDLATDVIAKGAPTFSARGEFRRRMRNALPTSVSSIQIRRPARRGYAVALIVCLLAMGLVYGIYRGVRTQEDDAGGQQTELPVSQPDETVASELESEPAETAEPVTDVADASLPEDGTAMNKNQVARTSDSTDPLEFRKGPIATSSKRTTQTAKANERVADEPTASARTTDNRSQNKRSGTRPRRVATPVFQQPRVSSIEAIMTGVPYDQRRRWSDEDEMRLQEERRRRRLRRMRDAQRYGYPY